MTAETDFTQPTDLHPELARLLWQALKLENIQAIISTRPYLPDTYLNNTDLPENRYNILTLFEKGLLKTALGLHKTEYFFILRRTNRFSAWKTYLYGMKFYRLARTIAGKGLDPEQVLRINRTRPKAYGLGAIKDCDLDSIMPLSEFTVYDREILSLFDKSPVHLLFGFKKTNYYKIQRQKRNKGFRTTLKWILKYYRLYSGVKKQGFRPPPNGGIVSVPWFFYAPGIAMRLDGHHRAAIARHLNHKTIPALILTPEDIQNHEPYDPVTVQILAYLHKNHLLPQGPDASTEPSNGQGHTP